MVDSVDEAAQKKTLRVLSRLKHSLRADREIAELLEQRVRLGSEGVFPQLSTTLTELLSIEPD